MQSPTTLASEEGGREDVSASVSWIGEETRGQKEEEIGGRETG